MTTISDNITKIEQAGLRIIGCFVLPPSDWEEYYIDIQKKIDRFRVEFKDEKEAQNYLDEEEHEINIFEKYKDEYSYCFFIVKKQ